MGQSLTSAQSEIIELPFTSRIFLEGVAGTGKTTAGVLRLVHMLESGISDSAVILLTPQRTLAQPYIKAFENIANIHPINLTSLTIGGLSRRMIDLFWPQVSYRAGFHHPEKPPKFLTLETAQYFLARLIRPLLEQGFFASVKLERNRLYSQIIDNLNKAAAMGFSHTEIGQRLKAAWNGDPGQLRVYDDAQFCASLFRNYCLEHNLLDFSLQLEVFAQYLWSDELCRNYLISTYRHLIVDNIEEDIPVFHDLLEEWLENSASALIIFDQGAGYRKFLGASPESAYLIKSRCSQLYFFENSHVMNQSIHALSEILPAKLSKKKIPFGYSSLDASSALKFEYQRFFPGMLDWVIKQINILVNDEHVPPGEIVVLAPFLSDSLRFSLQHRLSELKIPNRTHRPSRALRDDPIVRSLTTLAILAHPSWMTVKPDLAPDKFDVAAALMQVIDGLDLIRAKLITDITFRIKNGIPVLTSFDEIKPDIQERISYAFGEKYERLRIWLSSWDTLSEMTLDHFFSMVFGEVLSQPGFAFHTDFTAAEITANLIESVQKFRSVANSIPGSSTQTLSIEYIDLLQDGVIAAQYLRSWEAHDDNMVLLAPAYTFLMLNQSVDYQFWLDIGSSGWSERLFQPLTQPYILTRNWDQERVWTDLDEIENTMSTTSHLFSGLLRRCRKTIYLGLSDLSEQGYEQRGPVLNALQKILQETS